MRRFTPTSWKTIPTCPLRAIRHNHRQSFSFEEERMYETLKQQIHELGKQVQRESQAHGFVKPPEPLGVQIDRWLSETPPALLARPWRMTELQALFVGRYRQRPHGQSVATELRKRGWYTRRTWTQPGYGQRLWFAPLIFFNSGDLNV
jgi:hypothetical protein